MISRYVGALATSAPITDSVCAARKENKKGAHLRVPDSSVRG
jgi:hypothetical protein